MAETKTKWLASLSDGSTAIEGIEPFHVIPGELSPWLRLQNHLIVCDLYITGMRIQVEKPGDATRTYNLPSHNTTPEGKHERWRSLRPLLPESYNYFRWVTRDIVPGSTEQRQIEVRAVYEGFTVSLFVDENEGNESWVVIHENKMPNI